MARDLRKVKRKEILKIEKNDWVVTEKIHGANFSFVYQQGTMQFARRRGFLSWEDSFFGFQAVVSSIESNIQDLFEEIASKEKLLLEIADDSFQIIVYGELFGGKYPHPEVAQNRDVQVIQSGVYYSPNICFCAFDIALVTKSSKFYLSYMYCLALFEKHGIFHAKPLLVGPLAETLHFNTRIGSTIPKALGFPHLAPNLIEGVVLKPFCTGYHTTSRLIFKMKNREFDEDEQYRQSKRWHYTADIEESLSIQTADVVRECVSMVTSLRLESAVSKIGSLVDHVEEVKEEVGLDVLETLQDQGTIGNLTLNERKWVKGRIDAAIERLVAKTLAPIDH